jgi:hypothetical protein
MVVDGVRRLEGVTGLLEVKEAMEDGQEDERASAVGGEDRGYRVLQVLQGAFYRGILHVSECYKGATNVQRGAT